MTTKRDESLLDAIEHCTGLATCEDGGGDEEAEILALAETFRYNPQYLMMQAIIEASDAIKAYKKPRAHASYAFDAVKKTRLAVTLAGDVGLLMYPDTQVVEGE